ncbi:MAG: class I SAM-dependent DNA methyltransferase, partial [Deltaproteobacteria bacterium]|nr:class I SAM-dependent DNA methyltransferase [Deltaproteobacteria bacterium]
MNKDILRAIIEDFEPEKFTQLFRAKNRSFAPRKEDISEFDDDSFQNGLKLGEMKFSNEGQELIVCTFESVKPLSERSSKKAQYEKGRKVLKQLQADAGIFIFYDKHNNFRFSLIYTNYLGKKRDWSTFRRFTYYVSPNQTNKTFLQRIGDGDFSTLAKIKEAFSVEKVTKDFYKDIANWYFWAVQNSQFPKDAEAEDNGRHISIIRLITRLIFIWFMRERGLVPKELFDKHKVRDILKDTSPDESTYYKAILQNLFFATLSTKQEERKFRNETRGHKGYNPDFGNQYVYRYHPLFNKPEKIEEYFGDIPFLNGGLFECLDDKQKRIYIDGFTSTKKHQPAVPNYLFFSEETRADLNAEYGTKGKRYNVRGLLDTLSSYNFTIDENDPNDAEIALDPELLGKVFENLLASFNPETASTARKATGSYYTPREIVDYMVTQSLKEYVKTHLKDIQDLDNRIDKLFDGEETENPFTDTQSKRIVTLIDSIRIVDPAVGSGAFPMGILNKLVFILGKLDPENKLWKEA